MNLIQAISQRPDLNAWWAILLRTLREQVISTTLVSIGMLAIGIYVTQIYQLVEGVVDVIDELPDFFQELAGGAGAIGTPAGFIGVYAFGTISPAIMIAFAIIRGGNIIAGEEENGTLDQLLANPIGRIPAMLAKWTAMEIAFLAIAATLFAALYIGALIADLNLSPASPAYGAVSLFLLASAVGTITLAIGAATGRKGLAAGTTAAIVVFGFLINTFRVLVEVIDYFRLLSLLYFYNGDLITINGLVWWHVLALILITAAALIIGALYFRSRDLS